MHGSVQIRLLRCDDRKHKIIQETISLVQNPIVRYYRLILHLNVVCRDMGLKQNEGFLTIAL